MHLNIIMIMVAQVEIIKTEIVIIKTFWKMYISDIHKKNNKIVFDHHSQNIFYSEKGKECNKRARHFGEQHSLQILAKAASLIYGRRIPIHCNGIHIKRNPPRSD